MAGVDNKVALLVHTCDRYEFLYKGFESFFSRHWPGNVQCNYYFGTEEQKVDIKGFHNLQSGKGEWTNRLASLLQQLNEDYVLYFQEDMWLNKDVNDRFLNELFLMAFKNDWQQVKLHSSEVYKTQPTDIFIEGFNVAKVNNAASGYLMSHQVTLWNKKFLLQQLPKNEHPWRNERKGTKRLKKLDPVIYHIDYFAENGKPEINQNKYAAGRSEYRTISVNATLNRDVIPFITVLQHGSADEQQYAAKLLHHYNNNLTHDGKSKPRKDDVFKRIKNWIKG